MATPFLQNSGIRLLPATRAFGVKRLEGSLGLDRLLCLGLIVYLSSLMMEGPLRWILVLAGLPNVLYLRDAIPAASIALLFFRALAVHGRIPALIALPAGVLMLHGAVGLMLGLSPFQVMFGAKIFMYVLYGIVMWPLLQAKLPTVLRVGATMFGITLAGVAINFVLGTMPWEGLEYESAFGAVATTKQWWIPGGMSRLPGFARASFNAAMILGLTGLITLVLVRRTWLRVTIALATMAAIVATTSKGMLLVYPLAATWLIAAGSQWQLDAGRWLARALAAFTLCLPLVMVLFELGALISPAQFPDIVVSASERFSWMWPDAFALLPQGSGWVFGAGLGGIGTPQLFGGEAHRFNAADNLAVFLLINFGLAGIAYYALPALALGRVQQQAAGDVYALCASLLIVAYGYGVSISMIEDSFFAVTFGGCFGIVLQALGLDAREEQLA